MWPAGGVTSGRYGHPMGKQSRRPRKHVRGSEARPGRHTPPGGGRPAPGAAGTPGGGGRDDRRTGAGGPAWYDRPYDGVTPGADDLVAAAMAAARAGDGAAVAQLVGRMEAPASAPSVRGTVDGALARGVLRQIRHAWDGGWQPADLHRLASRRLKAAEVDLLAAAVVVDDRSYPPDLVDPRWSDQVRAVAAAVAGAPAGLPDPRQPSWVLRSDGSRRAAIEGGIVVLAWLCGLPVLPKLCPLPGEGSARGRSAESVDADALRRVRALLAKAESTSFEEEAQALTAKAQQLMTRHAIDRAALAAKSGGRQAPVGVRLGVDDPYAQAKAILLGQVAHANRCQAVWSKDLGFSTVIGFIEDLDDVELLYTSLLVQAQVTMASMGSRRTADGRSRTRTFRRSFLEAFAIRIGQRLHEASEEAEGLAVGEHGRSLLPVLADRRQAVVDEFDTVFPDVSHFTPAVSCDPEGWMAGKAAADQAALWGNAEVGDRATG